MLNVMNGNEALKKIELEKLYESIIENLEELTYSFLIMTFQ
jgi:hypothetical protein